jgi:hypothetical protein
MIDKDRKKTLTVISLGAGVQSSSNGNHGSER